MVEKRETQCWNGENIVHFQTIWKAFDVRLLVWETYRLSWNKPTQIGCREDVRGGGGSEAIGPSNEQCKYIFPLKFHCSRLHSRKGSVQQSVSLSFVWFLTYNLNWAFSDSPFGCSSDTALFWIGFSRTIIKLNSSTCPNRDAFPHKAKTHENTTGLKGWSRVVTCVRFCLCDDFTVCCVWKQATTCFFITQAYRHAQTSNSWANVKKKINRKSSKKFLLSRFFIFLGKGPRRALESLMDYWLHTLLADRNRHIHLAVTTLTFLVLCKDHTNYFLFSWSAGFTH